MFQNCVLLVINFALILQLVNGQCSVTILDNRKDPVYLTLDSQLQAPIGSALQWTPGQQSLVLCSGFGNEIMLNGHNFGSPLATITCQSGDQFIVHGSSYSATQIKCRKLITGDVINTEQRCRGGGTMLHIGFTGARRVIPYIYSCYNMRTSSVVYTKHMLYGEALPYKDVVSKTFISDRVIAPVRTGFKSFSISTNVNPTKSYTEVSQLQRFTTLLGSDSKEVCSMKKGSFLARGHMSPDADGIFRSLQLSTYWYINVIPQWQQINNANWKRIEYAIREKAENLKENLIIFTGVYGIMTRPGQNGNDVAITLEAGGIEVPRWVYKIIKSPATNASIALVTLNNPFVESIAATDLPCEDVCGDYGWEKADYGVFSKGFTICCSVADLKRNVSSIPSEALAGNVLRWI